MAGSSDARRPEADLARIALGVRYELGDRLGWNRWIYHHDEREVDEARDGRDVTEKIEIELVVERRVDRVRRTRHKERVAVRRRPHDRLGANIVAATCAVFYDELLAEPMREPGSDEPRANVGSAAGPRRGNDAHWPRRISLRPSDPRQHRQRGRACGCLQEISAWKFHETSLTLHDCRALVSRSSTRAPPLLASRKQHRLRGDAGISRAS